MAPILRIAAAALALGLLASAGGAQAVLVETPLRVAVDRAEAQAGERLAFTVEPWNASTEAAWRGKTVRVTWEVVDLGEGSSGGGGVREALLLDGRARATFDWTLPAAADDQNIFVVLREGEERLGQVHVRVGDAEPIAFAAGGPGGPGTVEDGSPHGGDPPAAKTPGFEVLLGLAALGAVALAAARRRA